jgi:hypothetical protein
MASRSHRQRGACGKTAPVHLGRRQTGLRRLQARLTWELGGDAGGDGPAAAVGEGGADATAQTPRTPAATQMEKSPAQVPAQTQEQA